MKKNYKAPQVEVIEIELEGVLCGSGYTSLSDYEDGGSAFGDN